MPLFRQFPFSRIPPYESQPYDLPPVLRPDPLQLDEAGVQPYAPSFGALMPPADLLYAQGQGFDPRFIHLAQSRPGSSGGRRPAPSQPPSTPFTDLSLLRGLYTDLPSPIAGGNSQQQSGTNAGGVGPKSRLPRGGPLPGADHTRPPPNFNFGTVLDHLRRDPRLARHLGEASEDDIRDVFMEARRDFMAPRPTPASEHWQKPAPPSDGQRRQQTGPARNLVGAPGSQTPDSRVVLDGQGGGGPGLAAGGNAGVEIGQGRRQVGAAVEGSVSRGGKPPKTTGKLEGLRLWLKTPEGQVFLSRAFSGNGLRVGGTFSF